MFPESSSTLTKVFNAGEIDFMDVGSFFKENIQPYEIHF